MAQEIRDVVFNVQVNTANGKVKIDGITKGFVNAETAAKRMQATLKTTTGAIKDAGISTGLANTAVLEFGRTISDAPYGIQGMGNNITQLVTIFGQMSEAAKEGESAIRAFGRALWGPLGIVLLIQGVIAYLEIYTKRQKEAAKEAETLAESVAKSAVELKIAIEVLNNENVSLENKNKILDELNKKYPDWNLQHSKTGEISEDNEAKILAEIGMLENLAKARAMQSVLEEYYAEKAKMMAEKQTQTFTFMGTLAKSFRYGGVYGLARGLAAEEDAYNESLDNIDKKIRSVIDGFKDEPSLLLSLIGGEKGKKGKLSKEAIEAIEAIVLEMVDVIDRKFIALGGGKFISTLFKGGKVVAKNELIDIGEAAVDGFQDWAESRGEVKDDWFLKTLGITEENFMYAVESAAEMTGYVNDIFQSEADRAIAIEQNKTNALNDQLKQRLANEQLSAQERDKINQQISKNEAALVAKENEINKKRFQQEKAFSIAQATMNTYLAASDVLAKEKGGTIAKIIGMAVVISAGLAQVAAIARQQFVGQAMPSPNLVSQGSGPAESQSPAFNVVGAGGQSQIAAAVAGQQRQPVKAYVVAGEVSTAQSLERNRISEASI